MSGGANVMTLFQSLIMSTALVSTTTLLALTPDFALAQDGGAIDVTDTYGGSSDSGRETKTFKPKTGRDAAAKYMAPRRPAQDGVNTESISSRPVSAESHYLALHLGAYISDSAYKWGGVENPKDVGKWNLGITYRVGEWVNSMDLAIRVDVSSFQLHEGQATKLSFLPVIMLPDSKSKFPLYFGAGVGAGVFVNQVEKESPLSLDYQVFAGARFFDLIGTTGFFIEAGLKNHLFLLSDGQFNGTFAAIGTVFSF